MVNPEDNPSVPILPAYETDDAYVVWCVWCDRWHSHGKGDGYRAAHCTNERSMFRDTGYILRRAGDWREAPNYRTRRRK